MFHDIIGIDQVSGVIFELDPWQRCRQYRISLRNEIAPECFAGFDANVFEASLLHNFGKLPSARSCLNDRSVLLQLR